jgi:hypothetical protein
MFPMTSEDPFAQPSASRQVADPESGNAAYSFDGKPDRWKRYRLPDPETGTPTGYTRATTFAKSISDTYALSQWGLRKVVEGLVEADDLYAAACALDFSDKEAVNRVANQAKEKAGAKTGANLGTAIHAFTEAVDRGENPRIPPKFRGHVAAWTTLLEKYNLEVIEIEKRVLHTGWSVAGTLDRIVRFTKDTTLTVGKGKSARTHTFAAGNTMILDLKTGRDLEYGWMEIAVQLDVYADASWIFDQEAPTEPWEWRPMYPEMNRDVALVIHIPAQEAEARASLYLIDIAFGRETGALCEQVRNARKRKNVAVELDVIEELPAATIVVPSERAEAAGLPATPLALPGKALGIRQSTLAERVQHAVTEIELRSIWFDAVRSREDTTEFRSSLQERRQQLLADSAAG